MLRKQIDFIHYLISLNWNVDYGKVEQVVTEISETNNELLKFTIPFLNNLESIRFNRANNTTEDFHNKGNILEIKFTSELSREQLSKHKAISNITDLAKTGDQFRFIKQGNLETYYTKNITYVILNNLPHLEKRSTTIAYANKINMLLEFLKEFLIVQYQKNRNIVSEEIMKQIYLTDIDNVKVKEFLEKEKLRKSLKGYGLKDYDTLLENRYDMIRNNKSSMAGIMDHLVHLNQRLETYKHEIKMAEDSIIQLEKERLMDKTDKEDIMVEYLHSKLIKHYMIEEVKEISFSEERLSVRVVTKPFKLYKFNQSPESRINDYFGSSSSSPVKEAFKDAYNNINNNEGWDAWVSPIEFTLLISVEPGNVSGFKINMSAPYAIYESHQNPHFGYSCYGAYEGHLEGAQRDGDLTRILSILHEYHSSIVIGDTAGDKYLENAILQRKGEEIQWQYTNVYKVEKYLENEEKRIIENSSINLANQYQ